MTQTTDSSSLGSIASRIEAKFSAPLVEESNAPTTQPEPTPDPAPESQQAPAAPEQSESEQAAVPASEETAAESEQPSTYTVKIDGKEHAVTLDDLLKGYSFTEHNTRKSQQLAEEKRALEAERTRFQEQEVAAVRAERSQYAEYLAQLSTALEDVTPKEPDWTTLRQQIPADQFAAEVLAWQQNKQRLDTVNAERARVKAQEDADAQAGYQQYLKTEQERLEAALPVMKDPEKAPAYKKSLIDFAKSRGFTDTDLRQVTDHRLLLLLDDARQYHESKAKAPAIENKIERVLATSQPGSRTTAPVKDALTAAKARAHSSGKADDIAEVIRLKFAKHGR